MDPKKLEIRSCQITRIIVVTIALGFPCIVMGQGMIRIESRDSSAHLNVARYTMQVGGGSSFTHSDGPVNPIVSVLGTEAIDGMTFGANVSWIPSSDPIWEQENFLMASGRYYTTTNLSRSPFYAFAGAGCVARVRAYRSASGGQTFFSDGLPGTGETDLGPDAELGICSSIPLSGKTFLSTSIAGNLNQFNSFISAQISVGFAAP
jgi:hypothetical protein